MIQQAIEALLQQKIGLDAHTIGKSKIYRAIENRRLACNLPDQQSYLQRLKLYPQELEELIEQVVIPETWFFRDQKPFIFLSRYILSEWLSKINIGVLKILSIPCCTGEEPFSIAMTLLDAGLNPHQFRIDAVDISKQAISKAQQAIYGNNSFRGELKTYQKRFFQPIGNQYQLINLVKNTVNFKQGNLLDPFFLKNSEYQVIFCRNLLIYLDQNARNRVVNIIESLLSVNGLLFVGSAETGIINSQNLTSIREPFTFAYKKDNSVNIEAQKPPKTSINPKQSDLNFPPKTVSLLTSKSFNQLQLVPGKNRDPLSPDSSQILPSNTRELDQARNLANQGNLTEAADLCQAYLTQNYTNPDAYVLLGEIKQSLRNYEQAEQCYQKALYLHPHHYEALMHLALLKESRGDQNAAKLVRQRIERLLKSQH